ncbi:MAG: terminase family protein [Anaerolineae bacterium]|nr:terminase family protein [Anaerolineae bacterium]NUQ07018.1 terminase, large subunit [Anaerolineae bacterium]
MPKGRDDTSERAAEDFTRFKQHLWTPYAHADHLALIDTALMQIARGVETAGAHGIRRLMIFTPPRHGKSMTVARLFPAWFLGRSPDRRVLLTSYAAAIVIRHSRFVRNLIRTPRYRAVFPEVSIARDSAAVESWDLDGRMGGLDAIGMQGSVTGRGAHLLIIDDPVKNRREADSADQRAAVWDAYRSDLFTRLEPGGAIILIMTRWNEDDLAGRLLQQEADAWKVLRLPALAEPEFEPDALERTSGAPLWAARFSAADLLQIRASIGARAFAALYQQRPLPREGALFRADWIETVRVAAPPALARVVVGVDPAASVEGAETGIIVAGIDRAAPPHAYVLQDLSLRATPDQWARAALGAFAAWDARRLIVETNQGGDMAIHTLRTLDPAAPVQRVHAAQGKTLRAEPIAALYEQGRVHHVGVLPALEAQMIGWSPGMASPDRLDALVWALSDLLLVKHGVGLR